jgi:hypothetical protein
VYRISVWLDEFLLSFFLEAFAKLRNATINSVMPVRPSVCPHETTRFPLGGFLFEFDI